jgi:ribonuclease G
VQPPKKLLSELDKTTGILRDILSVSFNQIVVNDKELFLNIRTYLQQFAPEQVNILSMYSGSRSVFDQYGISKQIKSSFGKTATMSSGAYLIVEHTEAMHVIDVNSGPKMSATDTEGSALSVNLEAAKEIARQIRLRDIGGLIVVDFIDMKNPEHKKKLHEVMTAEMKSDRAQHTILPLSKFGLMQITRERVRPEIKKDASEICPTCNGTGKVNASILLTDDIQRDLDFILQSQPELKPALIVHPYIEAFLKKGFFKSLQASWFFKYRKWIKISSNNDYQLMEYRFFDKNNDEIRLN